MGHPFSIFHLLQQHCWSCRDFALWCDLFFLGIDMCLVDFLTKMFSWFPRSWASTKHPWCHRFSTVGQCACGFRGDGLFGRPKELSSWEGWIGMRNFGGHSWRGVILFATRFFLGERWVWGFFKKQTIQGLVHKWYCPIRGMLCLPPGSAEQSSD